MSTEVHCLSCLTSDFEFVLHCHCHPENVLFCLGHLTGGKGELCNNTLRMAMQGGRAPYEH